MYRTNKELDEIAKETGLTVNGVVNAILDKTLLGTNNLAVIEVYAAIKKLYLQKHHKKTIQEFNNHQEQRLEEES